jgi:hypothetical protein
LTKVKMLTRFATPSIMAAPGQVIEVMDSVADSLIANGYAVLIMRKQEPIIETAALDREVDTAVKLKSVNKKKR